MSFWSKLGGIGASIGAALIPGGSLLKDGIKAGLGAAGAGLSAASQSSANNRGEKFSGQIDLEKLLMERDQKAQEQRIAREQEGRAGATDAWHKLLATNHLTNPGARPQLSPYSIAPRQPSQMELNGADQLSREVAGRLSGGNPIPQVVDRPLSVDPNLLNAGKFENIAGIGGAGLSVLAQLLKKHQTPNIGNV